MKILTVLTYYRPHTSGLTIYVERMAEALVEQGHEVTVLTSQFDPDLPLREERKGVRIVRAPVLFRISKGVIMPTFGLLAWKLVFAHDVVHLHLPQFDAAGVALRGRLLGKPTILTYHCDLELPAGWFNRFVNTIVLVMNHLAGMFAHRISAYTKDFASHSPFLKRFEDKVRIILPPVELPQVSDKEIASFKGDHNPQGKFPVIGMATRFATEKGVEVLLDALPNIMAEYPDTLVLYAGQYQGVMGEEDYFQRLSPRIERYQSRGQWKFLGVLNPRQMATFYPNLDVLVVPSLNSTETFGLVQIEAMISGTPTVASNLPGVRQPPKLTGMGEVAEIGNPVSLAENVKKILKYPDRYQGDPHQILQTFDPHSNAAAYERLYSELEEELR